MTRRTFAFFLGAFTTALLTMRVSAHVSAHVSAADVWRSATGTELKAWIPTRAPIAQEHIETDSRTATGIVDSSGRYVAGVVLVTMGYSADGKYSNLLVTQVPLKIGTINLQPGQYVFGWHHVNDSQQVLFYEAASGRYMGSVQANRDETHRPQRIGSFQILPPSQQALMLIGRFSFHYEIVK